MTGRLAALCGIVGVAAFGAWFQRKRQRQTDSVDQDLLAWPMTSNSQGLFGFTIDDDDAAEIIRRARPALERARAAY